MNSSNSPGKILIALASDREASLHNQVPELLLAGKPLDTLNQILVAIAVAGDKLTDERDGAKGPLLVDGVEKRPLVRLGELETGKDTAGLEHAVGLAQGGGHVGEVADAEGDGVQVERVVGDGVAGEDLGVGLEEGQGGLVRGGQGEGALAADGEHGRVDVGDGDVDVGVGVLRVRVLQHAEGDVASAAGDIEDALRLTQGRGGAGVEGGDEVVPGRVLAITARASGHEDGCLNVLPESMDAH